MDAIHDKPKKGKRNRHYTMMKKEEKKSKIPSQDSAKTREVLQQ